MKIRFACALLLCFLASGCDRGNHPGQIGSMAPDFTARNGGQTIHLDQYRGRVVVLNFWATWCQPCIEELPSLQLLQKKMPQVQILAISIDDEPQAYNNFLKQYGVTLLTARVGSEGANLKYGSVRVPETFIIDRKGVMRRKFIGPQDWTNSEITGYLARL